MGPSLVADDHRLISRTVLDADQQETLSSPQTRAEVSDQPRGRTSSSGSRDGELGGVPAGGTPDGRKLGYSRSMGDYAPVEAACHRACCGLAGLLVNTVPLLVT